MKRVLLCATLSLLPCATLAGQHADIALHRLTVTPARDTALRRLADSCITLLEARLKSIAVTVVRRDAPAPKDWSAVRGAQLAIAGNVGRVGGDLDIELQLIDAATGDELRSYLYRGPDAPKVIGLGVAASERIKAVVLEHRK